MWTLDELGQFPSLGHAVCEVDVLLAIVLGMEVGHVGVEHQSAQVQHQQPHGLPAEPVSMVDHVGVPIEGVDVLREFLDRMLGEHAQTAANDAAPEVVRGGVGGQQLLPQALEVLLAPHLLQQGQVEALHVQKVSQALHAVAAVLAESLKSNYPSKFEDPIIVPLQEFAWDQYLQEKKRADFKKNIYIWKT